MVVHGGVDIVVRGTVAILTGGGAPNPELVKWIRHLPSDVVLEEIPGNNIAWQRNEAVRRFEGDYLLFCDHDSVPPMHALSQMEQYPEIGVLGGVVLERRAPFEVCAIRHLEPYRRVRVEELPPDGVAPVVSVGTGFLRIQRWVFERMDTPHWFRCGQIPGGPDVLAEDLDFCLRAQEMGAPAYLHCGVRVGHIGHAVFWPGDRTLEVQWEGPRGEWLPYREPMTREAEVL